MIRRWVNFDTDRGGVLWGVLCCWLAVLSNFALLAMGVTIFYIVPWNIFGVPLAVTGLMWAVSRRAVRA